MTNSTHEYGDSMNFFETDLYVLTMTFWDTRKKRKNWVWAILIPKMTNLLLLSHPHQISLHVCQCGNKHGPFFHLLQLFLNDNTSPHNNVLISDTRLHLMKTRLKCSKAIFCCHWIYIQAVYFYGFLVNWIIAWSSWSSLLLFFWLIFLFIHGLNAFTLIVLSDTYRSGTSIYKDFYTTCTGRKLTILRFRRKLKYYVY